jgi:hypothetical protein
LNRLQNLALFLSDKHIIAYIHTISKSITDLMRAKSISAPTSMPNVPLAVGIPSKLRLAYENEMTTENPVNHSGLQAKNAPIR